LELKEVIFKDYLPKEPIFNQPNTGLVGRFMNVQNNREVIVATGHVKYSSEYPEITYAQASVLLRQA